MAENSAKKVQTAQELLRTFLFKWFQICYEGQTVVCEWSQVMTVHYSRQVVFVRLESTRQLSLFCSIFLGKLCFVWYLDTGRLCYIGHRHHDFVVFIYASLTACCSTLSKSTLFFRNCYTNRLCTPTSPTDFAFNQYLFTGIYCNRSLINTGNWDSRVLPLELLPVDGGWKGMEAHESETVEWNHDKSYCGVGRRVVGWRECGLKLNVARALCWHRDRRGSCEVNH